MIELNPTGRIRFDLGCGLPALQLECRRQIHARDGAILDLGQTVWRYATREEIPELERRINAFLGLETPFRQEAPAGRGALPAAAPEPPGPAAAAPEVRNADPRNAAFDAPPPQERPLPPVIEGVAEPLPTPGPETRDMAALFPAAPVADMTADMTAGAAADEVVTDEPSLAAEAGPFPDAAEFADLLADVSKFAPHDSDANERELRRRLLYGLEL